VNCIAPGVIATRRIMQTVIPGSSQSNRGRAELVALRRLGTVEDCAKVVEFLATVGIALSWRAHCLIKAAQILYRKYTFNLYSGDERTTSKSLIYH
jgi:NAD(P)-dependent dehydrogenase (short-subunit alcohol dehydrogenase family)